MCTLKVPILAFIFYISYNMYNKLFWIVGALVRLVSILILIMLIPFSMLIQTVNINICVFES